MHVEVIDRNLIESERLQTLGKRFVFKLVQSKSFKTAMLFSDVLFKPENKLCCLKKKIKINIKCYDVKFLIPPYIF